jgi:pyruvate dehydrogenase E2 component (dihydrolipoyllysine-residue acetyltransferase)
MADVTMPRLSDSMAEGTILRWLKSDGDAVRAGDELVEIETDKATETYEARDEGVLEVVAAVGETLPVGALIARLGANGALPPEPAPPAAPPKPGARGETTVVEATRAQGALGRRMAESRATIPDFTATVEAGLPTVTDALVQLRATLDPPPTLEHLVVKAAGVALREHPRVNGSYRDGRFELHGRVNVGLAVHTDAAPVHTTIFDADTRPFAELVRDAHDLAERARAGTITSPALSGATFTVSVLPVRRFTAIVTPPHAAALAVGTAGPALDLTLSADHRILFPADVAAFLARLAELLSKPASLLV